MKRFWNNASNSCDGNNNVKRTNVSSQHSNLKTNKQNENASNLESNEENQQPALNFNYGSAAPASSYFTSVEYISKTLGMSIDAGKTNEKPDNENKHLSDEVERNLVEAMSRSNADKHLSKGTEQSLMKPMSKSNEDKHLSEAAEQNLMPVLSGPTTTSPQATHEASFPPQVNCKANSAQATHDKELNLQMDYDATYFQTLYELDYPQVAHESFFDQPAYESSSFQATHEAISTQRVHESTTSAQTVHEASSLQVPYESHSFSDSLERYKQRTNAYYKPVYSPRKAFHESHYDNFECCEQLGNANHDYESGLGTLGNENTQWNSNQHVQEQMHQEPVDLDQSCGIFEDEAMLTCELLNENRENTPNLSPILLHRTPLNASNQLNQTIELNQTTELSQTTGLIHYLQAKIEEQQRQLNKEAQLEENANTINQLQSDINAHVEQIKENADFIAHLKAENKEKDEDLSLMRIELEMMKDALKKGGKKVVNALEEQASKCYKQRMYVQAIKFYHYAIDVERLDAEKDKYKLADLYLWIAQIQLELRDYNKAIKLSSTALRYHPKCFFSLDVRSKAYFALEQYHPARIDLEELMRLDIRDRDVRALYYRTWNCINEQRAAANDTNEL